MSNLSDTLIGKGYGHKETLKTSGTWNWANAGKPKSVRVVVIGGGGGGGGGAKVSSGNGSNGTDGGDTSWDTGGTPTTAVGGEKGTGGTDGGPEGTPGTTGGIDGLFVGSSGEKRFNMLPISDFGYGGSAGEEDWPGGMAATGEVEDFIDTPSGNISYTIGAAGTGGAGTGTPAMRVDGEDGGPGVIYLFY